MASATRPEDIELGEREHDAFLPSSPSTSSSEYSTTKPRIKYDFLTRYIPHPILDFYSNLTKLKVWDFLTSILIIADETRASA